MVGNDTIRRTAYLRRCIFGILRLPVPHIFRFRLELLPFILLFCDFGRGWRKLQLNFSVKGGKFGLQLLQLVLLSISSTSFFALYWSMMEGILSIALRKLRAAANGSAIARCPLL